jgi:hypothetical protein
MNVMSTELSPRWRALPEKLKVTQLRKKFHATIKSEGSLPHSQNLDNGSSMNYRIQFTALQPDYLTSVLIAFWHLRPGVRNDSSLGFYLPKSCKHFSFLSHVLHLACDLKTYEYIRPHTTYWTE